MMQRTYPPKFTSMIVVFCGLFSVGAVCPRSEAADLVGPPDIKTASGPHYVWEQPPIEREALSKTPFFCSWDEPSYAEEIPHATSYSSSYPMDDFRCKGPMPVTSIHWWGSYHGWQGPALPTTGVLPDAWRITFYGSSATDPNRPGTELQEFEVLPVRLNAEWAAFERLEDTTTDSCFKYTLTLDSKEYFWPGAHEGNVFWISIKALYKTQKSDQLWGWATRPARWGAGAQKMSSAYTTSPSGLPASSIVILPVMGNNPCGGSIGYDMAFALDTDPSWITAEQPYTSLRQWGNYEDETSEATGRMISGIAPVWTQSPDTTGSGQNVDATTDSPTTWDPEIMADDFQSGSSGPITDIVIWGGWSNTPPGGDAGNVSFVVSIRENVPASGKLTYDMPGDVLWTHTFKKGDFNVEAFSTADQGYSSSAAGKSYSQYIWQGYRYSFPIDEEDALYLGGTTSKPVKYWLSVQAQVTVTGTRFGWKTSGDVNGSNAVWAKGQEPYSGTWQQWSYPSTHPRRGQSTAMAFMLYMTATSTSETVEYEVADDWKSGSSSPIEAVAWWGSYQGYTYLANECNDKPQPVKPTYFLLSIWSNVPDPNASNSQDFGHPGERLWEYPAMKYDEVMVGFDRVPADANALNGREPVFRYSVKLPVGRGFVPEAGQTYWLSVMAAYGNPKLITYPWGWTNHEQTSGAPAVQGTDSTLSRPVRTWKRLYDASRDFEDMSFILFQQEQTLDLILR
jgi:hypothetical protein